MNWESIFNLLIGGGITTIVAMLTVPSAIKKAKAEAQASVIDNIKQVATGWKELSDERQEENAELKEENTRLNARIDSLYAEIGDWRNKYNAKCEEITALEVYKATNEVKLCLRRNCPDREPQSGY